MSARAVRASRMPPAALMPKVGPTVSRIKLHLLDRHRRNVKIRRGADEPSARLDRQFTGEDRLLTVEQVRFEDDFYRPFVRCFNDVPQLAQDITLVAIH